MADGLQVVTDGGLAATKWSLAEPQFITIIASNITSFIFAAGRWWFAVWLASCLRTVRSLCTRG